MDGKNLPKWRHHSITWTRILFFGVPDRSPVCSTTKFLTGASRRLDRWRKEPKMSGGMCLRREAIPWWTLHLSWGNHFSTSLLFLYPASPSVHHIPVFVVLLCVMLISEEVGKRDQVSVDLRAPHHHTRFEPQRHGHYVTILVFYDSEVSVKAACSNHWAEKKIAQLFSPTNHSRDRSILVDEFL